jgi:hypothetical protein
MFTTALLATLPLASSAPTPGPWNPRARAADEPSAWTFDFVPYYWSASISGSLTIDGESADVEDGGDGFFGDPALLGFLGHFEAHHGPWSFAIAPIFISADMEAEQSSTIGGDISIHAQVHEAFVAREMAAGFEWMAGLRYQKLATDLDLESGGTPLIGVDSSRSWLDPIVGLRYHTRFGADWSLHARADIGGFGVGSDFVWNASAYAGYSFSSLCALQIGYRALSFEFEDGSGSSELAYDLSMFGPVIGVSFSF